MERTFCIDLRPGWLILNALFLLLLPLRWVAAVLIGEAFHELCHILMLRFLKVDAGSLYAGFSGARIAVQPMEEYQEILCAAAGPAGSLALLVFLKIYPELAFCGLVQGLYNLLPVYPSDGGRVLRCILELFFPDHRTRVMRIAAGLTVLIVIAIGIISAMLFPRWIFVIFAAVLSLLTSVIGKFSCKESTFEVQ